MSRLLRVGAALLLAALFAGVACSEPTGQDINGETHFLRTCQAGSTDCGAGLVCACGVCTRACTASTDCSAFPAAACVDSTTATTPDACEDSAPAGHCDVTCGTDADCSALTSSNVCRLGFCRSASSSGGSAGSSGTSGSVGTGGSGGSAGTGGSGGTGGGGTGGDAGGAAGDEAGAAGDVNGAGGEDGCVRGQVTGNQVVVLGDSFMALNHEITAGIEGLARAAGALSAGQRYRDQSTLMSNALALGGNGILAQYSRAASEAAVKVAIMNGGGADVLVGYCPAPPSSACPVITAAVAGARDVFARMAADGVEQVIYAFYPDPEGSPLREKMDVFRQLAEAACLESPVPCHWLDLRPVFEGHYAEYVVPEGLNPTSAGALATANAIWTTMQAQCIAQ